MVLNTSDDFPDPEMPVKTVSRRFGISTLTSLRLFSRAPWTRIRSCRSAAGTPSPLLAGWRDEAMVAIVSSNPVNGPPSVLIVVLCFIHQRERLQRGKPAAEHQPMTD